ncbi:fasciclin domain-containing protein [Phenylobacterium terrae]|uniref:Fasciclin domain-containing protein n=1 Tax=Phenylobacterium terrae TaxID=2665495 RepID=A0ABW4N7S1_9CAUL
MRASGDIIETARSAGQFSTFLKAVEATNLTQVLKNNKGLTVFAPTDAAFAALPPGELERLMQPANRAQLQKILTYHVINAQVDSSKIKGARGPVPTVAGTNVELDGSGEALKVNDATIVQADVRPTNGTIHVIDKVLLPPGAATASSAPSAGPSASTSTTTSAGATASTSAPRSGPVASTGASSDAGAQSPSRSPGSAAGAADEGEDQ